MKNKYTNEERIKTMTKAKSTTKKPTTIKLTPHQCALILDDKTDDVSVVIPEMEDTEMVSDSAVMLVAISSLLTGNLPSSSEIIDKILSEFNEQAAKIEKQNG